MNTINKEIWSLGMFFGLFGATHFSSIERDGWCIVGYVLSWFLLYLLITFTSNRLANSN